MITIIPPFVCTSPWKQRWWNTMAKLSKPNHLGELDMEELVEDPAVLERKQTDHVTGVRGNVIRDGIIYLADRNRPNHRFGKVYVYDFGDKVIHAHHHTKRYGT